MKNTLSIYGSHDAAAVFINKAGQLKILEYERFVKKRYAMYSAKFDRREKDLGTNQESREKFIEYIKTQLDCDIDMILYNGLIDVDIDYLQSQFTNAKFKLCGHHLAHASSGYYTSGFDKAIIFSIDGGGIDNGMVSFTNIFEANNNQIKCIDQPNINLGVAYGRIGCAISEIKPGPDSTRDSLVYAGKVMGLCGYGSVQPHWVDAMKRYYTHCDLNTLGSEIGVTLSFNSIKEKVSANLAATSQYVFETLLYNLIEPYTEKFNNFVLVGGCALNVLFNQKLKMILKPRGKNLYVPSNPNDCGLALGQFINEYPELDPSVYSGFDILDRNKFDEYIKERNAVPIKYNDIVNLITDGKIIGMVEGFSEVGPRALGNRSIICDPSIDGMKDILNAKVKFREWFRPFAPVCRLQDKDRFFDNTCEAEFMSYAPDVKADYQQKLKAISHIDGSSRLQTVTAIQHKLFYTILSELEKRNKIPVILNTSFNIKGMPILTTIEDALYCLDNTEMDYVVIEGWLFKRKSK
mgnify:FL=1